MEISSELIARFNEKWAKDEKTGCWLWTASVAGKGYGQIKIPRQRRQVYAHRLSWLIHKGHLPDRMHVCHTCDNPRCVNPDHLFIGTSADNLQDMKEKGRHLYGERNGHVKLTDQDVREIRALLSAGATQQRVAGMYGVSQSAVWKIAHRERWAHIE